MSIHSVTLDFNYSFVVFPAINPEVLDQTQNQGDTASFTCQATGEPVPTISWYFNGAPVDEANTMKYAKEIMTLNTTTIRNTLTIMRVESSDVGTYTCNATNVVSTDTSSGVLTVNGESLMLGDMYVGMYISLFSCSKHNSTNRRPRIHYY